MAYGFRAPLGAYADLQVSLVWEYWGAELFVDIGFGTAADGLGICWLNVAGIHTRGRYAEGPGSGPDTG